MNSDVLIFSIHSLNELGELVSSAVTQSMTPRRMKQHILPSGGGHLMGSSGVTLEPESQQGYSGATVTSSGYRGS